jgi:membrane complex biogenesis BtpA family protein
MQILAGANKQALAAANAAGIDFIRAEGYVYAHIADEGLMQSDAGELRRYQKEIGAEEILIFTDIKKKHSSHRITSDIDIIETAKTAEFFLSDGIIVTGEHTGQAADFTDVIDVKKSVNIPVLCGSGINIDNISKFHKFADGFIIGSAFKKHGKWYEAIDKNYLKEFMDVYEKITS